MIFPPLRISQLSKDVEERRLAFEESKSGFERALKDKLSPLNIIKDHPQLFIGAAMSLFSAGRFGKLLGLFGGRNGHAANGASGKKGLFGTVLRFGGRTAVKTVMPLAIGALRYAMKSAFRAFRARNA